MHKPILTREQIAFFIYRFRKFDVTKREQRQRLIDSFVNAVYLYEDKIILTFNYKDGSKTITLAEVEGSDLSVLGAPNGVFITDLSYGHSFFISIASFHICIEQDLSRSFVLCSLAAYLTATLIRVAALYQLLRCLKLNLSG